MLNLSDLRVFLAAAEAKSLSGAARALSVPKSSVARQLERLETSLDATLFVRTTRALAPTDAGRALLPYARRLIDDSQEAARMVGARAARGGLLRISSPTTFGRFFVAPRLPLFRRRHPEIRVALELTSRKVDVGAEGADLAIRLGPIADAGLASRRLGSVSFALVAAPGYLKSRKGLASPDDLRDHDFIALRPPFSDAGVELLRGRASVCVPLVPTLETNDPETALMLCRDGSGVAALPRFLVAAPVEAGALRHLLPDWAPATAEATAVYSGRSRPAPPVKAFLDFLTESFADDPLEAPWAPAAARRGGRRG